jgi:hypothetical protein
MQRFRFIAAAIAIVSFAAACAGRSPIPFTGASSPAALSALPGPASERERAASATIAFSLGVPGRGAHRGAHRSLPAYVSASTAQAWIVVQGQNQRRPERPQKFACTAVCAGRLKAPVGVDRISLSLRDAKGSVLSSGAATTLVFAKKNKPLNLTLDGIVASVGLTPVPGSVAVAPAGRGYVLFDARDADGNLVTPDGDYENAAGTPLVFDVASSSTSLQLASKSVSAPGMPIAFTYDGTQHVQTITLTPSLHPGVKAHVQLTPAGLSLIPAIARRIVPPLPVSLLTVTQVAVPNIADRFDPGAFFLLGNSGGESVTLAYSALNGDYGLAAAESVGGMFANPPIDLGAGYGFAGYIAYGGNSWTQEYVIPGSASVAYTGTSTPCPTGMSAIGHIGADDYCRKFGYPGSIWDATTNALVANGQDRKIAVIGGATYYETAGNSAPLLPGATVQFVTKSGSTTPIPGAISVGQNVTNPAIVYLGGADGTVKAGAATLATFSNAVENVVGTGGSQLYVYENGGTFGYWSGLARYESAPLPIGAVVEIVLGPNGAPTLVEQDGTLDVIAI